jgi:hypothetical protein
MLRSIFRDAEARAGGPLSSGEGGRPSSGTT